MSKIGVISRMIRLSSRRWTRASTSSSVSPASSATCANGRGSSGEAALHQVEQLLVGLVERDGRAVAARLRTFDGYAAIAATSFAW